MNKMEQRSNQSEIWEGVTILAKVSLLENDTSDFADYYTRAVKDDFIFPDGLDLDSKGVFVRTNSCDYLDFVNHRPSFKLILKRVSKGYEWESKKRKKAEKIADVKSFLLQILDASVEIFSRPSVGTGEDIRIETPDYYINALEVEGEILSLSLSKK